MSLAERLAEAWSQRLAADDLSDDLDDADVRWWLNAIADEIDNTDLYVDTMILPG